MTARDCEPIIRKLAGCAGWKDTEKQTKEILGESLALAAMTPYHAEQIISTWVRTNRFLPTPADIHALAEDTPTHKPQVVNTGACSLCHGDGRESYWALTTTTRWEDSGRIKHRRLDRLPVDRWVLAEAAQCDVDPNKLALMRSPRIEGGSQDGMYWEAAVDGIGEQVCIVSSYCACEYGQHLKQSRLAGMGQDEERKVGRNV